MLADAAKNVLRHYDIPGLDQKTADWLGLLYACGLVYGTRIFAVMNERKGKVIQPTPQPVQSKPTEMPKTPPGQTQTIEVPGIGRVEVPLQ
jgi:hypothetical protein